MKGDWVYNRATYGSVGVSVTGAGYPGSVALALVDSQNTERVVKFGTQLTGIAQLQFRAGAESPERKRMMVLEVEGHVNVVPTSWALGNAFVMGIRVVALDQDPTDGAFQPQFEYNMWGAPAAQMRGPEVFANGPPWLLEERMYRTYDPAYASPIWKLPFRWRGRWRLQPQQGLALYVECPTTSQDARFGVFARTMLANG